MPDKRTENADQTTDIPSLPGEADLASAYDPHNVEDRWYQFWEENGLFHAEPDPEKKAFTIVIPPPNITGMLTMGHVLNNTIQDVFIRWNRLNGRQVVWIPGTDHAGIATQTVVEKTLKREKGLTRHDLGRDEFIKLVWEWREKFGGIIISQLRKLGVACDWERLVFTMDEGLCTAVREVFIRLYKKGLIYRGKRIINWDPVAHTALSDEEVIYKEQQGKLWHFRYPIMNDGEPSKSDFMVVATTRPETMLGDTAVAVNPKDERYVHLVGKSVMLPLMNRVIPIVADDYVDISFGTGVVKITPAHDPNDFEVGKRHNLEQINVMDVDASINDNGGVYKGLDRSTARKKIVDDLEALGLVEKIEDYTHSVGFSDRTQVPVEPYLSEQWFVNMKPLAQPALKVVRDGLVRFHPDRWVKTYEYWMTNIRDWTISRQLWWGHRIPVFYCDACGWMDAMHENPGSCPVCGAKNVRQDEDVLDTWFSSWLWPFSVHHWPVDTADLRSFYPTTLLVTAPDIIFFWVARMIMAGIEFMPDIPLPDGTPRKELNDLIPFTDVYFTSIIRDEQGRKMSKSLGNSPDPLVVIDNYSADALRFTVMYLAPLGQDLLFSENKCEIGRNFANKIWNAGRFLLMNKSKCAGEGAWDEQAAVGEAKELEDKWIQSRLNSTLAELAVCMEKYRVNDAAKLLYDFIWHDFCDWYIELIKERLYADDPAVRFETVKRALGIFEAILTMLHPIMPFITEELWHRIAPGRDGNSIMNAAVPQCNQALIDDSVCEAMNYLQSVVEQVRTVRGEMNVPPSRYCNVLINCHDARRIDIVIGNKHFLERLARIEHVDAGQGIRRPRLSAVAVVAGDEVFIPLEGLIDVELERARVRKEMDRVQGLLKGIEAKLANAKFTANAPADVVEKEKAKRENFAVTLMKLSASLEGLEEEA